MKYFLRNPDSPHRNAFSHEVKAMLGLSEKAKLPTKGMSPRNIQGIEVWVDPLAPRPARKRHRVMARCPECAQIMSAGRLHQHVCPTEPCRAYAAVGTIHRGK